MSEAVEVLARRAPRAAALLDEHGEEILAAGEYADEGMNQEWMERIYLRMEEPTAASAEAETKVAQQFYGNSIYRRIWA